MHDYYENSEWKLILDRLSAIREQEDFSSANVEFIRSHLQSHDERVRGGAALAAEGCLFEPYILDLVLDIAENDENEAIRKAAIQSLGQVIYEGVLQDFEDDEGATTDLEFYEEWDELQAGTLKEEYLRSKNLLFSILQNEFDDRSVREAALNAVSDLGFLPDVEEWIEDFMESEYQSSKLVAIHAMGKYPQSWEEELATSLLPGTPKPLLMEAISSSYSSQSAKLAKCIEQLLNTDDPDILSYALLTLANINLTEGLGEILQSFSLHADEKVRKAARDALENFSKQSFSDYLQDELGFEE